MKINQLDLFSGIGGFHLGFERAGYEVTSYFSEVDKHAIAVYKHQFPNSTYVGSVTDVRGADLPTIDLITFGSPCQDFSLAGKRKGMEGDRSSLVLEAIRLIGECRPRVFVWENVKGTFSSNNGEDFAAILQAFTNIGGYRLEWQLLNTSWFLPQNRERIYLVGYLAEPKRGWRGVFPIAENDKSNPEQHGVEIVGHRGTGGQQGFIYGESGIAPTLNACGYKDPTKVKVRQIETLKVKSDLIVLDKQGNQKKGTDASTLVAGYYKQPSDGDYLKVKSATSDGYEQAEVGDSINLSNPNSETRRGRVGKQKAQTLETSCNQAVVEPMIGIGIYGNNKETQYQKEVTKALALKASNQTNPRSGGTTLVGERIVEPNFTIGDIRYDEGWRPRKDGNCPTLAARAREDGSGQPLLKNNYRIRRLTPIECERLQGFPDDHTAYGNYDGEVKPMSNTQRYKQCGNAVTVDVVAAVAKNCLSLFK